MALPTASIDMLETAALLHDIGKIYTPRDILDKPGPLTEEQWVELRRHPQQGYDLIRHRVPELVAAIVLAHHERYDGTGYPNAVPAAAIPLEARVLQVADAFDAITSDRVYQEALPVDYALEEMIRCSGTQFDPNVVDAVCVLAESDAWLQVRFGEPATLIGDIAV